MNLRGLKMAKNKPNIDIKIISIYNYIFVMFVKNTSVIFIKTC